MAEELIELGAKKKGPRIPLRRAREIAERLRRKILPWSIFAAVAGSVRREKPQIGDIELVVLPKNLHKFLEHLADLGFMGGERIQRKIERGVKLEIYIAHKPEELGALLLTLTGDWQFNVALRQIAKRQGWLLNQYGLYDAKTGETLLQSPYEEDFLGALGVDYHTPQERSVADRSAGKSQMGARLPAPERRQVGYIELELWHDPVEDEWILWIGRTDPYGGEPWHGEFYFDSDESARSWFRTINGDEDLDALVRLHGELD